ncbi:MAG TPA: hypothetical protein VKX28_30790 [Xanthobacteraceae bacterium]|jgi:hypothetical protein|nr:hypothetical protein [Xanthobacteraceae bacterium]
MTRFSCACGAVYEVIPTQGPSRADDDLLKCVVCAKELFTWSGSNVGQLHLVARPERDRE